MKQNPFHTLVWEGFFMRNILFLLIAIISCYLFESWVSVPKPFSLTAVILLIVFNPIKIFAAACAFFIGFINGGVFIRNRIIMIKRIINRKDRIIRTKRNFNFI